MLDISDYEEVQVKSAMECCLRCVNKIQCTTVNIRKDVLPMRCRLITQSPINNKLIEASGWNVYNKVPVSYSHLLHTTFFLALNIYKFRQYFFYCAVSIDKTIDNNIFFNLQLPVDNGGNVKG